MIMMGDEIMPNWLGSSCGSFCHFFLSSFVSRFSFFLLLFTLKNKFLTLPFRSNFLLLANFLKIPEKTDIDCLLFIDIISYKSICRKEMMLLQKWYSINLKELIMYSWFWHKLDFFLSRPECSVVARSCLQSIFALNLFWKIK